MGERRDRDLRPSETMQAGPGGQVDFRDMLTLMDKFHDADKDLEEKIEKLEERRRDTDGDLFLKIEEATKKITKLETEFENLKGKDDFGDVPFYFRPAWVKAFGLAIAAVIAALIAAFLAMGGGGPPPHPAGARPPPHHEDKPAVTAPAEPGP